MAPNQLYTLADFLMRPMYSVYERWLEHQVNRLEKLGHPKPQSVGLILDGNRRYSSSRGISKSEGYTLGGEKADQSLRWFLRDGVRDLYVFGFSMGNFQRSPEEVEQIFKVIKERLGDLKNDPILDEYDVGVNFLGKIDELPEDIRKLCTELEQDTKLHTERKLHIALNYDGQDEIARAADKAMKAGVNEITTSVLDSYMDTKGRPHPDLIIRTSGEERMSGFLTWQGAQSEFVFMDVNWPGFRRIDELRAIRTYQQRKIRKGK